MIMLFNMISVIFGSTLNVTIVIISINICKEQLWETVALYNLLKLNISF